jgi:DNA-binding MarR family transcriptional regulator
MTGAHPRHDLDELLTNPVRLSIVAALADVQRAEFGLVRDSVEITDPALSKQVAQLEAAGYVAVDKGRVGRRPRTWLSLTEAGRAAYRRHLAALRAIAGRSLTNPS